jgi:3-mercaptopyruvate sulfurtransferase SseA
MSQTFHTTHSTQLALFLLFSFAPTFLYGQEMKKAISPNEFYAAAQKDEAAIASFKDIAKWLNEKSVILIDLRSAVEFNDSHIKGAINIPATDLTDEFLSNIIPTKASRLVI